MLDVGSGILDLIVQALNFVARPPEKAGSRVLSNKSKKNDDVNVVDKEIQELQYLLLHISFPDVKSAGLFYSHFKFKPPITLKDLKKILAAIKKARKGLKGKIINGSLSLDLPFENKIDFFLFSLELMQLLSKRSQTYEIFFENKAIAEYFFKNLLGFYHKIYGDKDKFKDKLDTNAVVKLLDPELSKEETIVDSFFKFVREFFNDKDSDLYKKPEFDELILAMFSLEDEKLSPSIFIDKIQDIEIDLIEQKILDAFKINVEFKEVEDLESQEINGKPKIEGLVEQEQEQLLDNHHSLFTSYMHEHDVNTDHVVTHGSNLDRSEMNHMSNPLPSHMIEAMSDEKFDSLAEGPRSLLADTKPSVPVHIEVDDLEFEVEPLPKINWNEINDMPEISEINPKRQVTSFIAEEEGLYSRIHLR